MLEYLKLEDMPGPTPHARELQLKQCQALEEMYKAWNVAITKVNFRDYAAADKDEAVLAAKATYEATVIALETLLGPDAHCNSVDTELWSVFSDCYKDDVGFRPRMHKTRKDVQAYLNDLRASSLVQT